MGSEMCIRDRAQGATKAALNARITELRKEYEESEAKLRSAAAGELRKTADKVEKKAV